jgi:hypothetical protein
VCGCCSTWFKPLLDPLRGSAWIGNSVLLVPSPPDRDTTVTWGMFFIVVVCRENKFEKVLRDPESIFLPFLMWIVTNSSRFHLLKLFISRDNVWLVNGSSDRDKEWDALDMYQSASAGIPWSPGDACKLVYSSFPCVLFWPHFTRRRRRSHQMDLVYLAPETNTFLVCLFVFFPQLVLSLKKRIYDL